MDRDASDRDGADDEDAALAEDREWQFSLEEVGPEADVDRRLEPQAIDPANAFFLLLGVLTAVGVFWMLLF